MEASSRRSFLKTSLRGTAGLVLLPNLIPSRLLGADAPGGKIQVAQIGCGRMGRSDLGNVMAEPLARVVAVCDLDAKRLAAAKQMAEDDEKHRSEEGTDEKGYNAHLFGQIHHVENKHEEDKNGKGYDKICSGEEKRHML